MEATMPSLLDKRVSAFLHQQLWAGTKERIDCCVCLRQLKCEEDHVTLCCGHRLHFWCVLEGNLKKCPLCRK